MASKIISSRDQSLFRDGSGKTEWKKVTMKPFIRAFSAIIVIGIASVAVIKYFVSPQLKNLESIDVETSITYKYGARFQNKPVILRDRIVHFDLKGAPPRVNYFTSLFPFMRQLGATGILLEYEDMFPYWGNLSVLRSGYAYTKQDISEILTAATENELEVIPLIQTFGHVEFILKHKQFSFLREIPKYPQVLCPTNLKTAYLLHELIDQVVALHPEIKTFHIGADEAYYVGNCSRCVERIKKLDNSKDKLMIEHVISVSSYIKQKHGLRVMMWNDMFQDTEPELMLQYGLGDSVEPVIWGYSTDLIYSNYFPPGVFSRMGKTFRDLWIASAFKGANGPDQTFIDVERYMQNHLSWLSLLQASEKDLKNVRGVILTAWSRFDHFAVLCELLPVSMPSLALNLRIMSNGYYDRQIEEEARKMLNCTTKPDLQEMNSVYGGGGSSPFTWNKCQFPGSAVADLVSQLLISRDNITAMFSSGPVHGWLSEWNLKSGYGHVFFAERNYNRSQILLKELLDLAKELRKELSLLFFDETVDEWLYENIQVYLNRVKEFSTQLVQLLNTSSFGARPLPPLQDLTI